MVRWDILKWVLDWQNIFFWLTEAAKLPTPNKTHVQIHSPVHGWANFLYWGKTGLKSLIDQMKASIRIHRLQSQIPESIKVEKFQQPCYFLWSFEYGHCWFYKRTHLSHLCHIWRSVIFTCFLKNCLRANLLCQLQNLRMNCSDLLNCFLYTCC